MDAFEVGPAWREAAARANLLDRLAMFSSDGWTGLLGLVLDLPGGKDTATVIEQIAAMPSNEVMRYALGYNHDFRRLTRSAGVPDHTLRRPRTNRSKLLEQQMTPVAVHRARLAHQR